LQRLHLSGDDAAPRPGAFVIDLFHDLQHVQPHVVLSTVTQRLSDRYPGRNVAVTSDETFDVEAWARHTGRATLESPSPSTLVRMVRDEDWYLLAGHSRFSWQGQVFDVVSVLVREATASKTSA
jgi:hypothetical protein